MPSSWCERQLLVGRVHGLVAGGPVSKVSTGEPDVRWGPCATWYPSVCVCEAVAHCTLPKQVLQQEVLLLGFDGGPPLALRVDVPNGEAAACCSDGGQLLVKWRATEGAHSPCATACVPEMLVLSPLQIPVNFLPTNVDPKGQEWAYLVVPTVTVAELCRR